MKKIIIIVTLISSIFMSGCAAIGEVWDSLDVFTEVDTFNDPKFIQREESVEKDGVKLTEKMTEAIVDGDFKKAESFLDSNFENYSKEEIKEYWRRFASDLLNDYYINQADYEEMVFFLVDNKATTSNYEEIILKSQNAKIITTFQRMSASHHIISFGLGITEAGDYTVVIPDLNYYIEKYEAKMDEEFVLQLKVLRSNFYPMVNFLEHRFKLDLAVDSILANDEYNHKYPENGGTNRLLSPEFNALFGFSEYYGTFDAEGNMYEGADKEFKRLIDGLSNEEAKKLCTEAWSLIEKNNFKYSDDISIQLSEIKEKLILL